MSALSAIDGWVSSDATQNLHEAIHSLRPQIGHTKGQGENHLICCSAFRSEMQVVSCSQTKCRNPHSGVKVATYPKADNGLALRTARGVYSQSMNRQP